MQEDRLKQLDEQLASLTRELEASKVSWDTTTDPQLKVRAEELYNISKKTCMTVESERQRLNESLYGKSHPYSAACFVM